MSTQQRALRLQIENLHKATDAISEAVADLEVGDAMFGCATFLAFYLSELKSEDRGVIRDRIVAMLHEVDKEK